MIYEESLPYSIEKVYDRTLQWLGSQFKAKIKTTSPPTFIEAKQGTMMTNTGHDPNWKKRIRISLYEQEGGKTLLRVEATPLARNVLRVEKLKRSWYEGLFIHLFSLFRTETQSKVIENTDPSEKSLVRYCVNCGRRIEDKLIICPSCGIDIT
ncbi:MAG: hypothetical protein ACW986_00845 [Promethearchaeota archaeon]